MQGLVAAELLEGIKITPKMGLWGRETHQNSASGERKGRSLQGYGKMGDGQSRITVRSSLRSLENAN